MPASDGHFAWLGWVMRRLAGCAVVLAGVIGPRVKRSGGAVAELTVRQDELVVTMEPREKRSLTRFGLRRSRSKLLDGLELRLPLAKVTGVHVSDAYWELPEKMDARNARRSAQTRGTYDPPDLDPWIGIFQVKQDGVWQKKLCFIHGQHSPVVAVNLDEDNQAAFTKLVISLENTSDSVAASIKSAAGLT
jgi:hypothetical protein